MSEHWLSKQQEQKRVKMLSELAELNLELANVTFYLRRHTLQSEDDKVTLKTTFERCRKRLKELEDAYKDIYSGSDSESAAVQKNGG